jgi:prevent-host-death family protein
MAEMDVIPEILPISDLRQRQDQVLRKLSEGPVILTQHGRASVVLVSPEQWNQMVEQIEDLQDALDAVEARADLELTIGFDEYLAQRGEQV